MYRAVPIAVPTGSWTVDAISPHGTIAGSVSVVWAPGATFAESYVWDGTTLHFYRTLAASLGTGQHWFTEIRAVNDAGVAVGDQVVPDADQTLSSIALRLANGETAAFPSIGSPSDRLAAVDAGGDAIGLSTAGSGSPRLYRPNGTFRPIAGLSTSAFREDLRAGAIDASGDVAGESTTYRPRNNPLETDGSVAHIFVEADVGGPARDLGTVAGCASDVRVTAMESSAHIVGICHTQTLRAWEYSHGTMRLLDPLPGDVTDNATGVSGADVVGTSVDGDGRTTAVRWHDGEVEALDRLVASRVRFASATGITADGTIAANASGPFGDRRPYVLVPLTAPAGTLARVRSRARIPAGPSPPYIDEPSPPHGVAAPSAPPRFAELAVDRRSATAATPALPIEWSTVVTDVVSDDREVFAAGPYAVRALDPRGKALWTRDLWPTRTAAGSVRIALAGPTVFVRSASDVAALSAKTGALLWHADAGTPAIDQPVVLAAAGRAAAVSSSSGTALFEPAGDPPVATRTDICLSLSVVAHLLLCDGATSVKALDPRTLSPHFVIDAPGARSIGDASSFALIAGGFVLTVHPGRGTFDIADTGRTDACPFDGFSGTSYYSACNGRLLRLSIEGPPERIDVPAPLALAGFAVANDVVVMGGTDGLELVRYSTSGPVVTTYDDLPVRSIAAAGDYAFVSSGTGVKVVDLRTGAIAGTAALDCEGELRVEHLSAGSARVICDVKNPGADLALVTIALPPNAAK